jgi:hypothetical protein
MLTDDTIFMINFYEGISPVSRMIRFRTWSNISHVSISTPNGQIYEAIPFKGVVQHFSLAEYHTPGTRIHSYEFRIPSGGVLPGLMWLLNQKGKAYDWRGLFGFLCAKNIGSATRFFCSELVMGFSVAAGRPLLLRVMPYQTTPRDVLMSPWLTYIGTIVTTAPKSSTSRPDSGGYQDADEVEMAASQSKQPVMQSNFKSTKNATPSLGKGNRRAQ